ncbi:hypothetical protein UA08_06336 [Talaromyces atroroseus]|uniref:Uncharacterized protein n=1 Tax=Talaromyces atroroseus TaxID=1441469 RepID=A0A225AYE6_TALAT|nr:hypothetical protein UA08_06336 [Talaromyces atroroseus]OKL58517.1 hypothetical protein UA08_06336 [Talaromyces atroroseus]
MALGDILARVFSLAALILILIVVFAGTQCGGALEDVFIVLVSKNQRLKTNPSHNPDGLEFASELGLYEFYTVHVLTYCAGYFMDDGGRNTTMCTQPSVPFAFDLAAALLKSLAASGSGQDDISWPYAAISDFGWVSATSKTISVLSILIIVIMGIGILIDGLIFSRSGYLYLTTSRAFSLVCLYVRRFT